jgi:parallel beta-helix repeat protein
MKHAHKSLPRLAAVLLMGILLAGPTAPARAEPEASFTYIVDTANDTNVSGCADLTPNDCSLRGAITKVNSGAAGNIYQILFNNNFNITLATALPPITQNTVSISAFSGLSTFTIRVNGNGIADDVFKIQGNNVEIDRLRIHGAGAGRSNVLVTGSAKNATLSNNVIGAPDATGACPASPARGVLVESTGTINVPGGEAHAWLWGNTVRCISTGTGIEVNGTDRVYIGSDKAGNRGAAQRNTIDGNSTGVAVRAGAFFNYVRNSTVANNAIGVSVGLNTINNWVQGNLIEKNAIGVFLANGAVSTRVGVDLSSINAADGNIIRASTDTGVAVTGANTRDNLIHGNVIGRGSPGEPATHGNTNYGILIADQARQNTIGISSNPLGRNVIGGNGIAGVALLSGANNNLVTGNAIGALDGDNAIPNLQGVLLFGSNTTANTVSNNLIARNTNDGVVIDSASGNTLRDANVIAFNGQHGVLLKNGAKDNIVRNMEIHDNGRHGVAISSAGASGNQVIQVNSYKNAGDGLSEWDGATGNTWSQLSAYENGGLGIDKDAGDAGANNVTPPIPTVTGMIPVGLNTFLYGGFASASGSAGASNKVEVYALRLDARGIAQGGIFLGSGTVDMATGAWSALVILPLFAVPPACVAAFQTFKPDVGTPASSSEYGLTNCRTMTPIVLR